LADVAGQFGLEAEPLQGADRAVDGLRVGRRAGRRDDADRVAVIQVAGYDGHGSVVPPGSQLFKQKGMFRLAFWLAPLKLLPRIAPVRNANHAYL